MNRTVIGFLAITALSLVAVLAAGCSDDDDGGHAGMGSMSGMDQAPEGSIRVDLLNWAVEPAQTSVPAGKVTFWAVHDMEHMHGSDEGGAIHDLQVMRKLPDGGLEIAGQVQGLKMGEAKSLTLNLAAGDYELSCNVVEMLNGTPVAQYAKGMHTAFTVV